MKYQGTKISVHYSLTSNLTSLKNFVLVSLLLFLFTLAISSVSAQSNTELGITPATLNLTLGESAIVGVEIKNGIDINAFDISITYDEREIKLDSWSIGSYLSNTAVIYKDIRPGFFRVVVTQLGSAGVSGDGSLVNIVFSGQEVGSSAIVITAADLVNISDELVSYTVENGKINVVSAATPTITFDPTRTFTNTPTYTLTPTRMITSTPALTKTATVGPTLTQSFAIDSLSTDNVPVLASSATLLSTNALVGGSPEDDKPTKFANTTSVVPYTSEVNGQIPEPDKRNELNRVINWFLWGFVVLSLIALCVMIIIYLKKNKRT